MPRLEITVQARRAPWARALTWLALRALTVANRCPWASCLCGPAVWALVVAIRFGFQCRVSGGGRRGRWRSIGARVACQVLQQRAPSNDAWAPLAPLTVRRKGHDTILVETGRLRESLTKPNAGEGNRRGESIDPC